ncbi:carbonic anhydrase [Luteibacter sp. UNCMF331Sha3.1]|uniref:carbonic anhydrase n=1 Tax=Luteibacter sp. UNCMF331Sha3.1 TaxID=1502760 RepID=UPI0008D83BB1|nr:carbonic anhydrase [Luteibacter sp. UNCMF331Sha3.1]SEN10757.1 carbonic anhydrase [Luteibacter sp. UNCMF331Sha3.1]
MEFFHTLLERNADFAEQGFVDGLRMLPSRQTVIIGCVDPRVDPADIFDLQPGEAVVIRNVGGRINAPLLETMAILRTVAQSKGKDIGDGWNLVVLHHTDCGIIGCYEHAPALLAKHLGKTVDDLADMSIDDPFAAVKKDVAELQSIAALPGGFLVSGLVYDVGTGKVDTIVEPRALRVNAA